MWAGWWRKCAPISSRAFVFASLSCVFTCRLGLVRYLFASAKGSGAPPSLHACLLVVAGRKLGPELQHSLSSSASSSCASALCLAAPDPVLSRGPVVLFSVGPASKVRLRAGEHNERAGRASPLCLAHATIGRIIKLSAGIRSPNAHRHRHQTQGAHTAKRTRRQERPPQLIASTHTHTHTGH